MPSRGTCVGARGYVKVIDAIERVARERRGGPVAPAPAGDGVGARAPRYQGIELALGDKPYVADMAAPGMVHGAVRFSDHPRAVVRRIDVSKARAHPEVVTVATVADVPGERTQGLITRDWRQLVAEGETTAYAGDVLAVVAAESRHAAREAAASIEVEYDVLEPVTDPLLAIDEGSAHVHEGGNLLLSTSVVRARRCGRSARGVGARAARDLPDPGDRARVPRTGGCLRPARGRRRPRVYSQGQGPGTTAARSRRSWASEPRSGGPRSPTAARSGPRKTSTSSATRRCSPTLTGPARARHPRRRESLRFHAKRHPMVMDYTVGADEEGRLPALRARIVGRYRRLRERRRQGAGARGRACLRRVQVPNVDVEARAVYTNNLPCGAMRGFGANQANFAVDGMLDRLAERVGIDGWEIRWRNALEVGGRFGTGQMLGPGVGLKALLEAVRDAYREARTRDRVRGEEHGHRQRRRRARARDPAARGRRVGDAVPLVDGDGPGRPHGAQPDRVRGARPSPENVRVIVDTERELDTGQTTASRSTVLGGRAVIDAAAAAEGGAHRWPPGGSRRARVPRQITWTRRPRSEPTSDEPVTHLAYGWATQVVILDDEGRLEKVVAAHDVGKAVNPTLLEGQIEGASTWASAMRSRRSSSSTGGMPVTETLKSLGIIPPPGCRRSSASSWRSRSRRGRWAPKASARSASCPPPPPSPARCTPTTASGGRGCR